MSSTVLVTGGRGYLGGRIARFLASSGDNTVHIGTRSPSQVPSGSSFVELDLASDDSMDEACRGVNGIVHLAALNEMDSVMDPDLAFMVNSLGTLKLLRAAVGQGVTRFVYMSTAHVYGSPLEGVITERTVTRPVHPYSITHRAAEDFVLASHDRGDLECIVFRLSNGFGAPASMSAERWTLLVNDLCRQAVVDRELRLKSVGLQKRDFVCLSDVERAVAHALSLDRTVLNDGLFNLGGENSCSVFEMAKLVQNRCRLVLGFEPRICRPASRGESESELKFDVGKLRSAGFSPQGDPVVEIDETLKFCLANLS